MASSVVPALLQISLNFINSLSFLNKLLSGWSQDKAIKLAPKIVSGLVKTLTLFFHYEFESQFHIQRIFQSNFFALILLFQASHSSYLNHPRVRC